MFQGLGFKVLGVQGLGFIGVQGFHFWGLRVEDLSVFGLHGFKA